MARLILDTGLLVAAARGTAEIPVEDDDDLALPAIVVAEYLEGVILTVDDISRAAHREFLGALSRALPVIDYDTEVAEHHAALLAHTRREGRPRGAHDLTIAATARSSGRTILTRDARARFDELPDVRARLVPT